MPTRNVNLTDELDQFVASKVKSGRFENASEVVRARLRTLDREEQQYGRNYLKCDGQFTGGNFVCPETANYADALCDCVQATGGQVGPNGNGNLQDTGKPYPYSGFIPTASGYALMQQMAEFGIETLGLTLKGGYLQNFEPIQPTVNPPLPTNVNTVYSATAVQFSAYGAYSDGTTHPMPSPEFTIPSGTWTSSSPLVMSVNQFGYAVALTSGTSTIRFLPTNGVKISSWVMYVR